MTEALCYHAFTQHKVALGVSSYPIFKAQHWPALQHFYTETQVNASIDAFPDAATPEAKLKALFNTYVGASLSMISNDLAKMSEEKQDRKMASEAFLENYVGEACERRINGRNVGEILLEIGVEDIVGFQQNCINRIASTLRQHWPDYYGKRVHPFDMDKFSKFFTRRFNAKPAPTASQKASITPTTPVPTRPSAVELEEDFVMAPLEVAHWPGETKRQKEAEDRRKRENERRRETAEPVTAADVDFDDTEFERNLITYAEIFGTPEPLLAGNTAFNNRAEQQLLEDQMPMENRFTDWARRRKAEAKAKWHKHHPHKDVVPKEPSSMPPPSDTTPPPPAAPEDGRPPIQSLLEGHYPHDKRRHHHDGDYDDEYANSMSVSGSLEDPIQDHADSRSSSPDYVTTDFNIDKSPTRLVSFEELGAGAKAHLKPLTSDHALFKKAIASKQLSTQFLEHFLSEHGAKLAGRTLVFLAPSNSRLSSKVDSLKALQDSVHAQSNLVATHLFECCDDSIRDSVLEPAFEHGSQVHITDRLVCTQRNGSQFQLDAEPTSFRNEKHNITVQIYEHDNLLAMRQ